jgi:hypothetical protein
MTARVVGCLAMLAAMSGSATIGARTNAIQQPAATLRAQTPSGFSIAVDPSDAQRVRMRYLEGNTATLIQARHMIVSYSAAGIVVDMRLGTLRTETAAGKPTSQPFQTLVMRFVNGELRDISSTD